jgi:hypothetical protein
LLETVFQYVTHYGQKYVADELAHRDAGDWRDLLAGYVAGHFKWLREQPELAAISWLFYYYAASDSRLGTAMRDVRGTGSRRLESLLELAFRSRPSTRGRRAGPSPSLVRSAHAFVTGLVLVTSLTRDQPRGVWEKGRRDAEASLLRLIEVELKR